MIAIQSKSYVTSMERLTRHLNKYVPKVGKDIHWEFDELEKAGISPLHVLQMTTLNGAEFLGRQDDMGTVEISKNADLVLLDANPIESVQNLHKINAVIGAGSYHGKEELDSIKEKYKTEK